MFQIGTMYKDWPSIIGRGSDLRAANLELYGGWKSLYGTVEFSPKVSHGEMAAEQLLQWMQVDDATATVDAKAFAGWLEQSVEAYKLTNHVEFVSFYNTLTSNDLFVDATQEATSQPGLRGWLGDALKDLANLVRPNDKLPANGVLTSRALGAVWDDVIEAFRDDDSTVSGMELIEQLASKLQSHTLEQLSKRLCRSRGRTYRASPRDKVMSFDLVVGNPPPVVRQNFDSDRGVQSQTANTTGMSNNASILRWKNGASVPNRLRPPSAGARWAARPLDLVSASCGV
ncbi:MAG: hypothetical protein ACREN3_01315 [Gemmatimonadaceae bacterium]